jgi:hypothetical protein
MYGAVVPEHLKLYDQAPRTDVLRLFPVAFTFICSILFTACMTQLIYINRTPTVAYFSSYWHFGLFVIPIIIATVHIVHVRNQAPNKSGVILALFLPSLLLLIDANSTLEHARERMDKLLSTDCEAFKDKAFLQKEWEAAYSAFVTCANQTQAQAALPTPELMKDFRLQDCTEYPSLLAGHRTSWTYLQYLETSEGCSGWCYPAQQLWSIKPSKDSCSAVVSMAYRYLVLPRAREAMLLMVLTISLSAAGFLYLGPKMREWGYETYYRHILIQ